jgi:hypothetical protein
MKIRKPNLLIALFILLLALVMSGCGGAATPTAPPPTPEPVIEYVQVTVVVPPTEVPPPPTPEPTALPDQSVQIAAWEGSPHGNTWGEGKGPNTWCSRCHSPQNWDPASYIGPPPSCFSCKFPTDPEMRIAEGNPFVPEDEWVGIPCETCHRMENGVATQGIAWLNPISMEYVDVNTSNELCEKCHVTTVGTGNPVRSAVSHEIVLGGPAHLNYAGFIDEETPPTYCTDCHDPHTQQPKQCQDCHEIDPTTHAKGRYSLMADTVTCMACHDSSGAEVGPNPDEAAGGTWTTTLTEVGRSGPTTSAIVSHSIQYEVACNRCHFDANPWELTVYTETGEIPEPTPTPTATP